MAGLASHASTTSVSSLKSLSTLMLFSRLPGLQGLEGGSRLIFSISAVFGPFFQQAFWGCPFQDLPSLPGPAGGLPEASQGPPRSLPGLSRLPAFQDSDPLSPVKGPLLAHRAFQSKIHKFREPRGLINFGGDAALPACDNDAACYLRFTPLSLHCPQ